MNILIADDHSIVRKGLIGLLNDEFPEAVIREATNGAEAGYFHAGQKRH
jgi:DNA-binding NarL/FixJ family response regulator